LLAESEVTMSTLDSRHDQSAPRALVVYESMFGNTAAIAKAVAEGLASVIDADVADVASAPSALDDLDLLVVGAPTHAFGLSRPQTRADAGKRGAYADAARSDGVREWIATIDRGSVGATTAAAFDTRVRRPRLPGSAARAARRRLRRLGFRVLPATSFWVTGTPGPLAEGELERAHRWGEQLATAHGKTRTSAHALPTS
jgi:Flavodoxin